MRASDASCFEYGYKEDWRRTRLTKPSRKKKKTLDVTKEQKAARGQSKGCVKHEKKNLVESCREVSCEGHFSNLFHAWNVPILECGGPC